MYCLTIINVKKIHKRKKNPNRNPLLIIAVYYDGMRHKVTKFALY